MQSTGVNWFKILCMGEVQMLFPIEPKEFWQKLKMIVEQVVIEHGNNASMQQAYAIAGQKPLLKIAEVCTLFKISKPTLYNWMNNGKLASLKIGSRRFFRGEDIERLIEESREQGTSSTTRDRHCKYKLKNHS